MAAKFYTPGSPLKGKTVPSDWSHLDVQGKIGALVAAGIAPDRYDAARLLGKHGVAVKKIKSNRKASHHGVPRRARG